MQEKASFPAIRFAGFTDAWEQRKLGEIGSTYTGLAGKTKEDFGHGSGRFVTYMNVFTNTVSDAAAVEPIEIDNAQNEVKYGDVFLQPRLKPRKKLVCPLFGLKPEKIPT